VLSIQRRSWIESLIIGLLAVPSYVILGLYIYAYLKERYFADLS
jgi:hypothetical protein